MLLLVRRFGDSNHGKIVVLSAFVVEIPSLLVQFHIILVFGVRDESGGPKMRARIVWFPRHLGLLLGHDEDGEEKDNKHIDAHVGGGVWR